MHDQARKSPLILIIDDDEAFLEIVGSCLRAEGLLSEIAHGSKEGIKKAREINPDLILLDMNMPEINGTEVLIDLKNNPTTKHVKVAFLTTLANPWPAIQGSSKKFAQELGAIDYLDKTRDLTNIVTKVKSLLGLEG